MQFDDHRLICSLESLLSFIFIRDNAQEFFAAGFEFILKELAAPLGQWRFLLGSALLIRSHLRFEGEATTTGKRQDLGGFLFIRDSCKQMLLSGLMAFYRDIYQLFSF